MAEPTLGELISQTNIKASRLAQSALVDLEDVVEKLVNEDETSARFVRQVMQDVSYLLDMVAHLEGLRAARATLTNPRQSEKIVHLQQIGSTLAVCQSEGEGEEGTRYSGRVTCPECKAAYERSGA